MVSAGEAARRLGVAPATVQRWVDSGVLHAERTAGGHRRIYVTELRRLIAANRPVDVSGPLMDWLAVLMSGDPRKVKAALVAARQMSGSWAETADSVASAIAEIGRRWEAGSCQVFEEHAASEALRRGAAICAPRFTAPTMPRASCCSPSRASATLWVCRWPSSCSPKPAGACCGLAKARRRMSSRRSLTQLKPDLITVSASSASSPGAIARYQERLRRVAVRARLPLVLAGSGLWTAAPRAHRILTFCELRSLLARLRKRARARAAD